MACWGASENLAKAWYSAFEIRQNKRRTASKICVNPLQRRHHLATRLGALPASLPNQSNGIPALHPRRRANIFTARPSSSQNDVATRSFFGKGLLRSRHQRLTFRSVILRGDHADNPEGDPEERFQVAHHPPFRSWVSVSQLPIVAMMSSMDCLRRRVFCLLSLQRGAWERALRVIEYLSHNR